MKTNIKALRLIDLETKLGIKKSKIYSLIKEGKLPPPHKIGSVSVWLESEIDLAIVAIIMPWKKGAENE